MPIKYVVVLAMTVAISFVVISWFSFGIAHTAFFKADASGLLQLGMNIDRSMEEHFASTGAYPKSLSDLSVDLIHADGGTQGDLDHATYITEGPSAVVVLARSEGPCVLLKFYDGKSAGMKFLNSPSNQ